MGTVCGNPGTDQTRGVVDIIYSSTTGTSKEAAQKLQEILESHGYIAPVTNIGDYNHQDLLGYRGTIIFLLSTYGNGDSPQDGENFLTWIQKINPEKHFLELQYSILAFGNSNFEKHVGFGLRTEKVLKQGGAQDLVELTKCDAGSPETNCQARFPTWSKALIQKLNATHPLKPRTELDTSNTPHAIIESRPNFDWQSKVNENNKVGKEFKTIWDMPKCKVIHIKQLRKDVKDGRSTLWIRIETNKDMGISPACNVNLFPVNTLENDPEDDKIVEFCEVRGKVPFPPMPLREIRKMLDYRQKISDRQIKMALVMATVSEEKKQEIMKKEKQCNVSVQQAVNDLKPDVSFLASINLNHVRVYTLSSWDPEQKYIDLVVSLVKDGLTSNYFKTHPQYMRIKPVSSTFYIPDQQRPICMIANGSGIAPFRSIAQYVAQLPLQKRNPLRFYYGIQSDQVDYYFEEQWKKFEHDGIIEMRVAQSRKDPSKKEYVQHVLKRDVDWLHQHLFKRNGVVFICGGLGMSREIDQVIHDALVKEVKMPYKAFTLKTELKQKRTIVEEVYG